VVIYHYGLHLPFTQAGFLAEFFNHGAVAVSFFFFLSGFVLAYNYTKLKSIRSFYWKRFARLYPLYLLTFFVVLYSLWFLQGQHPDGIHGIANALGLQAWIPGYALQVNFPAWSLSVEFFFYAAFPLIIWMFNRLSWRWFSLISGLIWILGLVQHIYFVEVLYDPNRYFLDQFILYFPLFHFSTFVAGVFGGKLIHRLREKSLPSNYYSVAGTIGILLFVVVLSTENPFRLYGHNGALSPIFLLICVGLSLDQRFFPRLIGTRPFVFLGDISYGIYMWQFPVYLWFSHFLAVEKLTLVQFLLYLLLLIGVSAISLKWFEEPIRQHISKKVPSN
jgi:peptidoglycan/LPS O-acetylase OafA/YrhL